MWYRGRHRRRTSIASLPRGGMALLLAALLVLPGAGILVPKSLGFAEETGETSIRIGDGGDRAAEVLADEGFADTPITEGDAPTTEQPSSEQAPAQEGGGAAAAPSSPDETADDPDADTTEGTDDPNDPNGTDDPEGAEGAEGDEPADENASAGEGEEEPVEEDSSQPGTDDADATVEDSVEPQDELPVATPEPEQTDGLKVFAVDGVSTLTSQQAEEAGWEFYFNGPTVAITGYTGSDVGAIDQPLWIPTKIDDCAVTTIVPYAFSKNLLPNARDFVSLAIPQTVTNIGREAFQDQKALRQLTLSEGLRTIGISAFERAGVTAVHFPSTIQSIGDYAFADTVALAEISFYNRTITLGDFVFRNTTALKSVALPGNMMTISEGAFQGSGISTLTIGEGIREIQLAAFENTQVTSLEFPASLRVIEGRAFAGCTQLQVVRIPASVTLIRFDVFDGVPKSLHGFVEAGSLGVAFLREQGFTDYEVTARSETGDVRAIYRKDVLPDNVTVTVTEFSDEMLQQAAPVMELMQLQLVATYQIAFSADGVPVVPTSDFLIRLNLNPLFAEKTLMLFEMPDPAEEGEEGKKEDGEDKTGTGDEKDNGSVLGAAFFVPADKLLTEKECYLVASYWGQETLRAWSGKYFVCQPLDPEDKPAYVDPNEERRSQGLIGIQHTFGDADTAALMTRTEGPRYEGRSMTGTQVINNAVIDKFLAQTAAETAIPDAAIPQAAPDEALAQPGTSITPALAVRVAGADIPVLLLFAMLVECVILGVALFYMGKALRARNIEGHL